MSKQGVTGLLKELRVHITDEEAKEIWEKIMKSRQLEDDVFTATMQEIEKRDDYIQKLERTIELYTHQLTEVENKVENLLREMS